MFFLKTHFVASLIIPEIRYLFLRHSNTDKRRFTAKETFYLN